MRKIFFKVALIGMSVLLSACGKESGGSKQVVSAPKAEPVELETEVFGTYAVKMKPLNEKIVGKVAGAATITREKDNFIVDIRMSSVPAWILHTQSLHVGKACPTEANDLNGDGFIDIEEAQSSIGDVLIPLDGDLNTQKSRIGWYPVADQYGSYMYSETASYERMLADLQIVDEIKNDHVAKLSAGEKLNLLGRVVVIYGVPENSNLPDTVKSRGNLENYQTLPIACGVIQKMHQNPLTYEEEVIIVDDPIGETVGGSGGTDVNTGIVTIRHGRGISTL
jgi:hypothetical protein